jgi:hypothetical protein
LVELLQINKCTGLIWNVVLSRRYGFVRITIYRLLLKEEIDEYPSNYFIYHSKTFLCYDGSEVIYHKRVTDKFINGLKEKMTSGSTNDSRVFQFDVDYNNNVKQNMPAINPYDFNFETGTDSPLIKFPPPKKIKHSK